MLQGVLDQFGTGFDVELLHDAVFVKFGGPGRDVQNGGGLDRGALFRFGCDAMPRVDEPRPFTDARKPQARFVSHFGGVEADAVVLNFEMEPGPSLTAECIFPVSIAITANRCDKSS